MFNSKHFNFAALGKPYSHWAPTFRSQGRPWKRVVPAQEEEDESGHPWRCWDGLCRCRHLRPASIADIADIADMLERWPMET